MQQTPKAFSADFLIKASPAEVEAAIKSGADPNAPFLQNGKPNPVGSTPMMVVARWDRYDLVPILIAHGVKVDYTTIIVTPLDEAASFGNYRTVKALSNSLSEIKEGLRSRPKIAKNERCHPGLPGREPPPLPPGRKGEAARTFESLAPARA
jgi:hypothetical protein